jgi:fructose-1,6-bisphosphatase/inositol monophosphatase family enzyme
VGDLRENHDLLEALRQLAEEVVRAAGRAAFDLRLRPEDRGLAEPTTPEAFLPQRVALAANLAVVAAQRVISRARRGDAVVGVHAGTVGAATVGTATVGTATVSAATVPMPTAPSGAGGLVWRVTPIDNPAAFAAGLATWTTSLLVEHAGRALLAAVHPPWEDRCWSAVAAPDPAGPGTARLGGARPSGARIHPSNRHALAQVAVDADDARVVGLLAGHVASVSVLGSPGLSLAHVAAGGLGASIHTVADRPGVAAGMLIAEQAGALIAPWPHPRCPAAIAVAAPGVAEPLRALVTASRATA